MPNASVAGSALLAPSLEHISLLDEGHRPLRPTPDLRSIPVLMVEKDVAMRRMLAAALHDTEFHLLEAETAGQGLAVAARARPEAVLLEILLPDLDGIHFVRRLREWSQVPIIIVSEDCNEDRKIDALESGADDYVTKPFSIGELVARMRTTWRRSQLGNALAPEPIVEAGDLRIDVACRHVTFAGEEVRLTPIEYRLLLFLARHAGRVVTHRQILSEVWGNEYLTESQYLRVYVGYLRKKLEQDPAHPRFILTEARVGYRLVG